MTLKELLELLPADLFIQIHRSYINQNFIEKIERNKLTVSNIEFPIGPSFSSNLEYISKI